MNGLALCAGVGGLERGIESIIPSSRTVCFVEGETYPASVLASKMEAGLLSKAPIWSNVRTFNGKPWRGKVSFVSGGFPCQPYSQAGKQLADKAQVANTNSKRAVRLRNKSQEGKILKRHTHQKSFKFAEFESWWKVEPTMGRMVDGVADWVHRMRACGNGVVPQQAAYAYSILMERCGFMVSKP